MSRDTYASEIHVAEQYYVKNFANKRHPGPSLDYFRPDISSPKSIWNKALAFVFAQNFVNSRRPSPQSAEVVERAFTVHLNQIIKMYKAQKRVGEVEVQIARDKERIAARESRRRKVCDLLCSTLLSSFHLYDTAT